MQSGLSRMIDRVATDRARLSLWQGLFALALVLYLADTVYQFNLPGLNYDEALDAVPAMETVLRQPVDVGYAVHIAGRDWPAMIMPYIGATTSYLLMPPFAWFGAGYLTLRATTVFVGFITLILIWAFLREYFDERAAGLAVLLLAVNPIYVFWSRMGAWVAQPLLPLAILTLWTLHRWYKRRSPGYLILAAFCLGFGVSTKILFLWLWAALGLVWLILSPWLQRTGQQTLTGHGHLVAGRAQSLLQAKSRWYQHWLWPIRGTAWWLWACCAVALLAGSSLLLWYNLRAGGTLDFALNFVMPTEAARANSLETLRYLLTASWTDIQALLTGSWFATRWGGFVPNPAGSLAFWLALAALIGLALHRRLSYSPVRVAFVAILLFTILIEAGVTRIGQGAHHLLMITPLPQALIAVAALSLADTPPALSILGGVRWRTMIGVVVVGLIATQALTTYGYYQVLARTGGDGVWSDAIFSLATDLERPGTPRVYAMDWGFRRNLQLLTQNRINLDELLTYTQETLPQYKDYLDRQVKQDSTALYLFHTPETTAFPGHWELFQEAAYRARLYPTLWRTYRQRDARPVFLLYKLEPLRALPETARTLQARLGDGIALLGYETPPTVRPGDMLSITLYWQALATQSRDSKVFAHLFDDTGKLWAQHDSVPMDWTYPTTDWKTGEIVPDRLQLPLAMDIPAGTYHLFVGMYDASSGQRLPLVADGQRLKGDTLGLTDIVVKR